MRKVVQTLLFISLVSMQTLVAADEVSYEKIYKKHCATCHGNTGNGKGRAGASLTSKPTDFTAQTNWQRLTTQKIHNAIEIGLAGTSMVGYSRLFDKKTIDGLTDYIERSFMGGGSKSKVLVKAESAGQLIYIEHCSACHGDRGQSAVWAQSGLNPPPRNFTTEQSKDELSLERMVTSVTYGRPGTAMMSFKKRLSETQINAVVTYIRENFMQKKKLAQRHGLINSIGNQATQTPHEISVDMSASFPKKLVGNANDGKLFFESNCFTCHGKKGDGKGPRAHFNYPRPRNFNTDESRLIFNRPRLYTSISQGKRGSVMPTWKTVLSEQEIANVAEYVFQAFILNHSVIEKKKKVTSP